MQIKMGGMGGKFFLILCAVLLVLSVDAQQKVNPFDSLVQVIEGKTAYRFFYDPRETSKIEVDRGFNMQDIPSALKLMLQGTGLFFAIDGRSRIFITRGAALLTSVPPGYFRKAADSIASSPPPVYEPVLKKEADAALENRIFTIGPRTEGSSFILSGYIRDSKSGEPLGAASIVVEGLRTGVATDAFGFYSITIPKGRHAIRITSMGMKETRRQLDMRGPGKLDVEMTEDVTSLKAAVIVASKQSSVRGMQMGVERLNIKTIRQIPAVFGETDIMRSLLTLPGVTSVGEGTAGYNVRGGAVDQNLVLLNDMTLYNPTHLFGFFSAVDPEVVRGVELYKSAIPEKYGGRISSVLDVSTRDGNSKKFTGTAGIGPLTSKLTLEGPVSEKTTVLFGGRVTYSDWLLKQIDDPSFQNSEASFYDMMLHVSHTFSEKDRIYFSAYTSKDKFRLNDDSTYSYNNRNLSLKWKHNFSNKLAMVMTGGLDQYRYNVDGRNNPIDAFTLKFGVQQVNVKADLSYNPDNRNSFSFGIHHINYNLDPGTLKPADDQSIVVPETLDPERGTETALYLGDQFKVSDNFSVQAGLRYSLFRNLGPGQAYTYAEGLPRDETTIIDSTIYGKGDLMKMYHGPELRLSARYLLNSRSSLKISYNTLRQYIHMLTNTTAISPTDIWKLSDQFIKPLTGQQISAGYYTRIGKKEIEFSVEAYYKLMRNYLDYKSGAQLIMNEHIEQDIIATRGQAYGVEIMAKKTSGKLTGWASYTYSRTFLKVDDPVAGETINGGDY
jgi:hypothetical protein